MEALGEAVASLDEARRTAAGRSVDLGLVAQASLAKVVSQLTNGLAHETRNSLNALAIHLEVLADKLREPGTEKVPAHLEKNLQAARAQIRRLDDVMRRFGEFASGRTEARDPARAFANAVSLCAYHLRRTGTEVVLDLPDGVRVRGEAAPLAQLAVEIVLAATTADAGGRVAIIGTAADKGLVIRVAPDDDHGAGFDPSPGLESLVAELGGALSTFAGETYAWEITLPVAKG